MPHNLYLHSSLMREKYSDNQEPLVFKESLIYNTIETGISLLLSFIINIAVISTFAYYEGNKDLDL